MAVFPAVSVEVTVIGRLLAVLSVLLTAGVIFAVSVSAPPANAFYQMTPWDAENRGPETRAAEWRLSIERTHNPDCKYYHVYALVTSSGTKSYNGPESDVRDGGLVSELFARGITDVSLKPYQVLVCKARVYRWAELEPGIIATLKRNLIIKKSVPPKKIGELLKSAECHSTWWS